MKNLFVTVLAISVLAGPVMAHETEEDAATRKEVGRMMTARQLGGAIYMLEGDDVTAVTAACYFSGQATVFAAMTDDDELLESIKDQAEVLCTSDDATQDELDQVLPLLKNILESLRP